MRADRWELGSDFHWQEPSETDRTMAIAPMPGLLLSSGRDALRVVLNAGTGRRGWRRLWVPDYFCQEVVASLIRPDLELRPYVDHPLRSQPVWPNARAGDAIVVMNYGGLRPPLMTPFRDDVEIIEDHSHDPASQWARSSTADYCVASLRKTMPLPDGGVVWSPRGHSLPVQPPLTPQRQRTAATRLMAMVLKSMYLAGHDVEKEEFRSLAHRSERGLAVPAVSAMSPVSRAALAAFPLDGWRDARAKNHATLAGQLAELEAVQLLAPAGGRAVPLSCLLLARSQESREHLRRRLIDSRVFPAVLWSLERPLIPVSGESLGVSRRMLSIPCDGRYDAADMLRVGEVVRGVVRR